jgi:hypothetical protein
MSKNSPARSRRRVAQPQLRVKVAGDRRVAEALHLEMRRLARRFGLTVGSVRIRRVEPPSS